MRAQVWHFSSSCNPYARIAERTLTALGNLTIPLISHAYCFGTCVAADEVRNQHLNATYKKEIVMYLKLIAASLALAFLAGCNTMAGAGKDIEKGGEAIQNSANKNKSSN